MRCRLLLFLYRSCHVYYLLAEASSAIWPEYASAARFIYIDVPMV